MRSGEIFLRFIEMCLRKELYCMQPDIRTLCQYRLERAKEDLLAAETNHQAGLYKAAINRSYYAIFTVYVQ